MKRRAGVIGAVALAASSCGSSSSAQKPHHTVHDCSPFASNQCATPFPNAWFEQADASTATHSRVLFPDGVLPSAADGTPLNPKILGNIDGFSPATQIIAYFPQGVDATQLTPSPTTLIDDRIAPSLTADFPIALVDVAAKARVPFFAELDANADPSKGARQALLIHPMVRLKNATRYAVAIRTTLRDAQGHPLAPEGQFAQWVSGKLPSSAPLWEVSDRLDEDTAAFAALGIPKGELALAWDFDTASDEGTTGQLTKMVNQALTAAPQGMGFTITSSREPTTSDNADAYRIIEGTFQAPSFEAGPDPSVLKVDANGQPVMGAAADWPFTAVIPRCAVNATAPVPFVIYGHGLFGSAHEDVIGDASLMNQLCMVAIGSDWLGVAKPDLAVLTGKVLVDPNNFNLVTDRLEQAHVNFQVLTRLAMNGLASDSHFAVNGHPAYDPSQRYYWGASNGGIQGATYMSLSQDIDRALLNVPGADWTLLMWRSGDFAPLVSILQTVYSDWVDFQLVMALTQSLWDRSDPIEFTPHMIGTSKQVLFQESIGDPAVSNVATRTEMRTLGVKALAPLIQPVFGITDTAGPLTGLVYTQWSIDPKPLPPLTDTSPVDNGAHDGVRDLPKAIEQMKTWLQPNGQAVNPCGGPCVFPQNG